MTDFALRWLLAAHAGSTVMMTGLIWFVQIVHYPMFDSVGRDAFPAYEQRHSRLTTWVVAPLMLVELGTAVGLVLSRTSRISPGVLWTGLGLLVLIWLSTAAIQVPCHDALARGFDPRIHRRLVSSNWIRTLAWSARSGIALWLLPRASQLTP